MYTLAVKPFNDKSVNIFVFCSELVLASYYMTFIVGVLSLEEISIETVGSASIKIVIAAFGINTIFSLYQFFEFVYDKFCSKSVRVIPINFDAARVDRSNVTRMFETEHAQDIGLNRSDVTAPKNLFVRREENRERMTEMISKKN